VRWGGDPKVSVKVLKQSGNGETGRFAAQDARADANREESSPAGFFRLPGVESAFRADKNRRVPRWSGRQDLGQGAAFLLPQHQAQLLPAGGKSLGEGKGSGKMRQDRPPALPAGFPDDPAPAVKPFLFAFRIRKGNGATGQQRGKGGNSQFRSFLKNKVHLVSFWQGLQEMYREGGFFFQPSFQNDSLTRASAQSVYAGPTDLSEAVQKEDFLAGFEAQDPKVVENFCGKGDGFPVQ
jgi:hypothetical protein